MYEHPVYGDATVEVHDGALQLRRGVQAADLEHWNYDTFQARYRNRQLGKALVTFELDAKGKPSRLVIADLGTISARPDVAQSH